jgi:hypothetical protein
MAEVARLLRRMEKRSSQRDSSLAKIKEVKIQGRLHRYCDRRKRRSIRVRDSGSSSGQAVVPPRPWPQHQGSGYVLASSQKKEAHSSAEVSSLFEVSHQSYITNFANLHTCR